MQRIFVERRDGKVVGSNSKQSARFSEEMQDADPEYIAFMRPPVQQRTKKPRPPRGSSPAQLSARLDALEEIMVDREYMEP